MAALHPELDLDALRADVHPLDQQGHDPRPLDGEERVPHRLKLYERVANLRFGDGVTLVAGGAPRRHDDFRRPHQCCTARRNGDWEFLATPELRQARQESGGSLAPKSTVPARDRVTPRRYRPSRS